MKLFELFQPDIAEVSMSPGALTDFAQTPFAQSMTAGFEAELVVPNVKNDEEDIDSEPDMDMDERITSWSDIEDFFVGDYNSRRDVQRVIEELQEEFFSDAAEAFDQQMLDDQIALAREEAKSDGFSEEEIDEIFSDADSREYEKYMDNAKEELENTFFDDFFEGWIRKNYPRMSNITRNTSLTWPHWIFSDGGEVDIADIASEIEDAIGMKVKGSSSYHGTKRGSDFFILEPDSSIDAYESDGEGGLELVSPPMPLNNCLDMLDKVFDWAKNYGCRTNKSTGFHMGISIPDQTMENVDHLKFTLFLGDEYVLREFGRQSNVYAKSMIKQMAENLRSGRDSGVNVETMLDTFKQGLNTSAANMMKNIIKSTNDRYVTVNIKKNYIEVRSAGGDYLDSLDKIKLTLLRYVRAMGLAADPEAERQEYAKKLYKFLSPLVEGDDDVIKYFAQFSSGTLPAAALKSFVKNVQQQRSAKQIPDILNVNSPTKGTYAFLIKYILAGNIKKALRVYASGRSDAMKKAEDFLDLKKISGAIYHIEADINDPTNQTSTSSGSEVGTYIIQYQSPNRFAADQIRLDANSAREAEEYFRSNFPATYRINSVQLQR